MDFSINNALGVRRIASKWTIILILLSSVRIIASKWTIRLIICSSVREIAGKRTIILECAPLEGELPVNGLFD